MLKTIHTMPTAVLLGLIAGTAALAQGEGATSRPMPNGVTCDQIATMSEEEAANAIMAVAASQEGTPSELSEDAHQATTDAEADVAEAMAPPPEAENDIAAEKTETTAMPSEDPHEADSDAEATSAEGATASVPGSHAPVNAATGGADMTTENDVAIERVRTACAEVSGDTFVLDVLHR